MTDPEYDFENYFSFVNVGSLFQTPKRGDAVSITSWTEGNVKVVTVHTSDDNFDFTVEDGIKTSDGKEDHIRDRWHAKRIALQFIKKYGLMLEESAFESDLKGRYGIG